MAELWFLGEDVRSRMVDPAVEFDSKTDPVQWINVEDFVINEVTWDQVATRLSEGGLTQTQILELRDFVLAREDVFSGALNKSSMQHVPGANVWVAVRA